MCLFRKKKQVPTSAFDKIDKEYLELFRQEQEMERKRIEEEVRKANEEYRAKQKIEEELKREEEEIKQAILLSSSAFDYKKVDGGYSVTLNDKKLLKLKLKRLIVPDNYQGVPVVNINKMGVNSYDYIKCVTIPKSIVSVNEGAFLWCEGLKRVHYLGTIDDWAQIEFGDGGANPLRHHTPLYIGDEWVSSAKLTTAKKIGAYAFYNSQIDYLSMPEGLTTIGKGACGLTNMGVTFSKTVTTIGEEAFKNATLKDTYFPASLEKIGARAFEGCSFSKVVFINSYNWWTTYFNEKRKFSASDLDNPKVCANYLSNRYCQYEWYKA